MPPHRRTASGQTETGREVRGPAAPVVWPLLFPAGGEELGGDLQQCCGQSGVPGMGEDRLCPHGSSTFSSFFSVALKPPGQRVSGSSLRDLFHVTDYLLAGVCHFLPLPGNCDLKDNSPLLPQTTSLSVFSQLLPAPLSGWLLPTAQHLRCVNHGERSAQQAQRPASPRLWVRR